MKNIAELVRKPHRIRAKELPHDWPLSETLMGIEVEVERGEGVSMPADLGMWAQQSDGSLQNGVEYVLKQPQAGSALRGAIYELMTSGTYTRTMTGSTHIHMDMLESEDTPEMLRTMVMLVYALESMLYAAGDASREWCGFANRLRTGPDGLLSAVMNEEISHAAFKQTYHRNSTQFGRYYGLNMAALLDYGSLEFRYFPTATSEQELVGWVELVQTFKKAARALGDRKALNAIIEDGDAYNTFLYEHFGKWEELFRSLGPYYEVRNNYRKALITANVSDKKEVFIARKVFTEGRFAKFIKKMPAQLGSDVYPVVVLTSSDNIPLVNTLEENTFMVYARTVYYPSSWNTDNGQQFANWRMLGDDSYSRYAGDERFIATLRELQDGDYSIDNSSRAHIGRIIEVYEEGEE
jgi:hypothetical protein